MHIVFLTSEYPTPNQSQGGIGSFVQKLDIELVRAGHSVSVVGFYNSSIGETFEDGISIFRLPCVTGEFKFFKHSRSLNAPLAKLM
jgi:hypothetical protein